MAANCAYAFLMLLLLNPMDGLRVPETETDPFFEIGKALGEQLVKSAEKFGQNTQAVWKNLDSLVELQADPYGTIAQKQAAAAQKMFTQEMAKAHKDFQEKTKASHDDSRNHHQAMTQPLMDFAKLVGKQVEKLTKEQPSLVESNVESNAWRPNIDVQTERALKLFNSQVAKAQEAFEKHMKVAQGGPLKVKEAATNFAKEASRHMEKLKTSKASLMEADPQKIWAEQSEKATKLFNSQVAKTQQTFEKQMKALQGKAEQTDKTQKLFNNQATKTQQTFEKQMKAAPKTQQSFEKQMTAAQDKSLKQRQAVAKKSLEAGQKYVQNRMQK